MKFRWHLTNSLNDLALSISHYITLRLIVTFSFDRDRDGDRDGDGDGDRDGDRW